MLSSCTPPSHSDFNTSTPVKHAHILDGSEAHFKCEASGNPKEIHYKWFINDELVIGDYTTEMVNRAQANDVPIHSTILIQFSFEQAIYLVNRSHHGAVVKCEATNEIGIGEAQTTLNVHCKWQARKCYAF